MYPTCLSVHIFLLERETVCGLDRARAHADRARARMHARERVWHRNLELDSYRRLRISGAALSGSAPKASVAMTAKLEITSTTKAKEYRTGTSALKSAVSDYEFGFQGSGFGLRVRVSGSGFGVRVGFRIPGIEV